MAFFSYIRNASGDCALRALRIARMSKVAVTGGAGFIGSNLTRRLLSQGYEVNVVDDLNTGLLSNVNQEKNCVINFQSHVQKLH